ncbi:OmpA family protein [Cyclobacterium sp. 1_MG-2023]|uniref:OmpA family protein n=1 Tax=Cyclobacterium sp. 1_MG-2023 TaxID=3062681 RepID=UPI0026E3803A|nr:OmpA family protein [Cyclobacterium sp. 1_MG-2023]MDO6439181.1 OmpA family protein [Cyclobacterium sp. 1_MG-2023]
MAIFLRASAFFVLALFTFNPSIGQTSVFSLAYDEQQPIIAAEGGELYFTLAYHPQNKGGLEDSGDVWFAQEGKRGFSAPVPVQALSTEHYDLLIGFRQPNEVLVYHANLNNQQVIQSYIKEPLGWKKGEAISIPGLKIEGDHFSASLDSSGQIMIMAMDSYGSYGNEDIYMSQYNGTSWTRPVNIGGDINTAKQELSPRLSSTGDSLYFASNAYETQKGIEVYASKRLDNTWRNWSPPVLLKLSQMQGVEMYYSQDLKNNRAFFTNTQTSEGFGNIYMLENLDFKTIPVPALAEKSFESRARNDLNDRIDKLAPKANPITEAGTQVLSNLQKESKVQINMAEKLDSLAIGEQLILENVLFKKGTVDLSDSSSLLVLDELATFMVVHPEKKISIEGHTDSYGNANVNMRLSLARADKIKELLVQRGVEATNLQTRGWGGKKPIATNSNEAGRKRNRRVEIKLIAND